MAYVAFDLENAGVGIAVVDIDTSVVFANSRSPYEITGQEVSFFISWQAVANSSIHYLPMHQVFRGKNLQSRNVVERR